MKIDWKIKIDIFDGVYEPSDDTYLLIESIDIGNEKKALDMGCGSGIIALHLAKYFFTVAADINEMAIKNTTHNAEINGINIKVVKSDLFSNIEEKFDIIAFNPPYLPVIGESISWDGGKGGISLLDKFFKHAWKYLNENGKIYFVISSLSDFDLLKKKYGFYNFKKIMEKSFFFEKLYSYVATVSEPFEDMKENH